MRKLLAVTVALSFSCTTIRVHTVSPPDAVVGGAHVAATAEFAPEGLTVRLGVRNASDAAIDLTGAKATLLAAERTWESVFLKAAPIPPGAAGEVAIVFPVKDLPDGNAELTITGAGEPWTVVMDVERVSGGSQSARVRNSVLLGLAGAAILVAWIALESCGRPEAECF